MPHATATWASLQAVRERAPLVHNITNFVAMDVTANCLLALGASPAMVHAEEEVEDFVAIASSLVVNIGTLSPPWVAAMARAAARARALGRPWVLDPVGAGATPYRHAHRARPDRAAANRHQGQRLRDPGAGRRRGRADQGCRQHARYRRGGRCRSAARALLRRRGRGHRRARPGHRRRALARGRQWRSAHDPGDRAGVRRERGDRRVPDGRARSARSGGAGARDLRPRRRAGGAGAAGPGSLRWRLLDELALLDEATVRAGVKIA